MCPRPGRARPPNRLYDYYAARAGQDRARPPDRLENHLASPGATTLLRVARAQAGQLEVRRQDVEADEQLRAAVESVYEVAQRRGIELVVDDPDEVGISADPDLLDLILVNLLTNAAQHAPDGDQVRCDVRRSERGVEFLIENTNVGLEAADMPHLTETFWKKKDQARKDPVHTGLGLALVDQLAETCGYRFSMSLVDDRVRATLVVPL